MSHVVRFQVDGQTVTVANFSYAKKAVRQRYPYAKFHTEEDGVACEFEGNLIARIRTQERRSCPSCYALSQAFVLTADGERCPDAWHKKGTNP